MANTIRNLTSRPIYVALNSGTDLRLSPGAVAADIEDVDLKDNARVNKLLGQRVIAVDRGPEPESDATGERPPEKKRPKADPS